MATKNLKLRKGNVYEVRVEGPTLTYHDVRTINSKILTILDSSLEKVNIIVDLLQVTEYKGTISPIVDGIRIVNHKNRGKICLVINKDNILIKTLAQALAGWGPIKIFYTLATARAKAREQ